MTDFTQNNFNFWEAHPGLRPFIEAGALDLAIFDAVHDPVIHLAHAKKVTRRRRRRRRRRRTAERVLRFIQEDGARSLATRACA